MRYSHDANTAALALDQTSTSLYGLYQQPLLGSSGSYSHDNSGFYPSPQVYPGFDYRPRLNTSAASSSGMATHHSGPSTLPHPSAPLTARERYTSNTPAFKRSSHQQPRSPVYCGSNARRHDMSPLNPAPAVNMGVGSTRSDRLPNGNCSAAPSTPPLTDLQTLGTIVSEGTTIKPNITGTIDKGFFLSDSEWTCYRRNYFSCNCSFTLSPLPQTTTTFCPAKGSTEQYHVFGWAMSISAVVSENQTHAIELVQHTPKRDKGPTHRPDKIPMAPKLPNSHHSHLGMYTDASMRAPYADAYGNATQPASPAVEHSFERIQFKQATQNNGKRRAAQQYYHLVMELFADVGSQKKERYVKVAFRKSAPMIVRGRSPGHYSSDRRGSQSSGANNQNLGTYQVLSDYPPASMMVGPGAFTATYDARTHAHNGLRHNEVPAEQPLTAEEEKTIDSSSQRYMYFPDAGMSASHHDRIDSMQTHGDHDGSASRMNSGHEQKVKPEYEFGSLSRQFNPTSLSTDRSRCGPFEGKPTSNGYYPNMLSQSGVSFSGVV